MSVIAIESAMEHTYAEPEDQAIVQRALDAAEDRAQDFLQRNFYVDAVALAAARATVPTLRSAARTAYRNALDAAAAITDEEVRNEAIADADQEFDDALVAAQRIQNGIAIKPAIIAACLLITGHLYTNREDVVIGTIASQLPSGAEPLLWPSRVGLGV